MFWTVNYWISLYVFVSTLCPKQFVVLSTWKLSYQHCNQNFGKSHVHHWWGLKNWEVPNWILKYHFQSRTRDLICCTFSRSVDNIFRFQAVFLQSLSNCPRMGAAYPAFFNLYVLRPFHCSTFLTIFRSPHILVYIVKLITRFIKHLWH